MSRSKVGTRRFTRLAAPAVIAALALSTAPVDATAQPLDARGGIPAVNNFNPDQGSVGTVVHVYGANFTGATSVAFNGTPVAGFTVVGPGNISTTVPNGATTGPISVTT